MDVAAMKHMDLNFSNLDKFEVVDFRRWQKKMQFLLSSMSVVYVLTTSIPNDGDDSTVDQIKKRVKWDNDDYVCRSLILNGMSDSLFDIYQNVESFKELWDSLEAKYMAEDASSKKFLISNFTNYKMADSRPVIEQYNELLSILGRFTQHKMNMDEAVQVSFIIDKLPPSWKDFNHTLKHLKEELALVELGSHLRIEESVKMQDSNKPKGNNVFGPSVVNMVEHNNSSRYNDNKGKRKHHDNTRDDPNKKSKDDDVAWWVDSGATVHVCKDRCYAEHSKAFRFYVIEPNESVSINSIIKSKDAIFDKNRFFSVPGPSLMIPNETEDIGGSVVLEEVTEEVVTQQPEPELIKGKRNRNPKDFRPEFQLYLTKRTREEVSDQHSYCFNVEDDPKTFNEAMKAKAKNSDSIMLGNENKVCKLIKSLYGLKQAPKQWHQKFDKMVLSSGYLLNQAVKCVYSKFDESSKGIIFSLYVDDMLIFGNDQVQVDLTKKFLSSKFSIKDTGEANVILSIRIKHESNGIAISQSHYIEKVLKKFNYFDCTSVSTPIDTCEKLMPNNGQAVSQLDYSRVIGCLMYAMTCTRPDIAFVMGKLSRYTNNPSTQHWQAIQRVLKYLKKTMDYSLTYTGYPSVLKGYTDASWISNTKDNSSTSGWVFLLGGGAISWASKKQTCITGLTIESEFLALAAAGKEAEWLKNLLLEIPLWSKPIAPISIRCDSSATLTKAYSQMYNGKSRHLGVRHSMIHELVTNEVISIEFLRSQQNLLDHLIKGLARDLVTKSTEGM
uniref:Zinc finger, CCHC-type n=1 Tax=Tanacetum cinerariifolium TaxID=118510 RepID=A0A699I1J2_TANCI|nr:zinc finger, CCHC-type [Tanacetum cinerariifolium]